MIGLRLSVKASDVVARKLAALRAQDAALSANVSAVVRDSALSVLAGAKDRVPRSTNVLFNSLVPSFYDRGWSGLIASFLPYAAKQEYDSTLNHDVRQAKVRVNNTKAGKPGSVIKGTNQNNPNAQWGFLRKSLAAEKPTFLANLQAIASSFGDAWAGS